MYSVDYYGSLISVLKSYQQHLKAVCKKKIHVSLSNYSYVYAKEEVT